MVKIRCAPTGFYAEKCRFILQEKPDLLHSIDLFTLTVFNVQKWSFKVCDQSGRTITDGSWETAQRASIPKEIHGI